MTNNDDDPAMANVRERYEKSGMTMHDLGVKMGYDENTARKSVSQFLKGHDPRISMLRRFAKAVGVKITTLIKE